MAGISKAEREALAEVKSKFDSHEMTEERAETAEALRKAFAKLAVELHRNLPKGRNASLAMTHLEDSAMRAIRALSHDADETPVEEPAPAPQETAAPAETEVEKPKATRKPRKRTAQVPDAA